METELNAIADTYLRHHATKKEEDFWAWQEVFRIVSSSDVDRAWEITLLLLRKAETDQALNYVAAGPLEDLIDRYGHQALDRIEEAANHSPRIQLALSQVCVLFYYEEFERWYGLLYRYGFKHDRVADKAIISTVMKLMDSYLNGSTNVYQCGRSVTELLDKPLDDKTAQQVLQKTCGDFELLDAKRPPDYREPYLTEPEVRRRVTQALTELQSLGYGPKP